MEVLVQAFVLGIVAGFIPGAVLTLLLVSTLQGGLSAGIRAFWWSMLSEILIAGGLLLLASLLPLSASSFTAIGIVGGAVLLYFAWNVFQLKSISVNDAPIFFTAPKIFMLSATNAPLYIFWSTICFPLIWQLASNWSLPIAAIAYFLAFEIAWALSTLATVLIFAYARPVLTNEQMMRKVFICIALILAGLGIKMFLTGITLFI